MLSKAGMGVRIAAGLIDAVAVVVLYYLVRMILEPGQPKEPKTIEEINAMLDSLKNIETRFRIAWFIAALLPIAYSLTDVFLRQSPGKMIMKLKIYGDDEALPTMQQLLTRWGMRWGFLVLNLILGLTLMRLFQWLYWLGALGTIAMFGMILVNVKRRALYDDIAKTTVYQLAVLPLPPGLAKIVYWDPSLIPATPPAGPAMPPPPPAAARPVDTSPIPLAETPPAAPPAAPVAPADPAAVITPPPPAQS